MADILSLINVHSQIEGGGMSEKNREIQVEFDKCAKQLPVICYNSSRYDLSIVKSYISQSLDLERSECHVIKKQNVYSSISTSPFKFIDVNNYVTSGTSYDEFSKTYHCVQEKSYLPYEWDFFTAKNVELRGF